jgi:two-component system sensor histidine kinase DevS
MAPRSPFSDALGEGFLWSLLDAAPDTILLVDDRGRIVFVHEHGADLFGYSPEQLLETSVDDLLPADRRPAHRADRTRYRAEPTVRAMGSGLALRARRADNTEFPVEVSLSPLKIGGEMFTVAAVRDISERVQAEDYLHRVLHTLDASDDGVFIFDAATLRYSYVNEGAVRLTGYSHEELAAMTPLHLNSSAVDLDYRQLVEALEADPDQAIVRQTMLLRKDGEEVPIEKTYQSAPVGRDGTKWIIALARDSSARLQAELDLRRSQDALRDAEQVVALAEDRQRIARDLHDTVIQRLFGAGLNLQATAANADSHTRARLETTITDLDETIKELRTTIYSLQGPSSVALGGVRGRLLQVIRESRSTLGFEPRLQFDGPIETMDDIVVDHLVPTLREALSNVGRHAAARKVRVAVIVTDVVTLSVTDDGSGLPDQVMGGRGLTNMAERATGLGGIFETGAAPGGGTRLRWQVPSDRPQPSSDRPSAELAEAAVGRWRTA